MHIPAQATFPSVQTLHDQRKAAASYSTIKDLPPLVFDDGGNEDESEEFNSTTPITDSSTEGFPFTPQDDSSTLLYAEAFSATCEVSPADVQSLDLEYFHRRGLVQKSLSVKIDAAAYRKTHQHQHNTTAPIHVTLVEHCNPPDMSPPLSEFCYSNNSTECGGRRKALCIGINYNQSKQGHLEGCVNDAHRMRDFLINYGKYKPEDIVTLTDDGKDLVPTRKNILNAMRQLVHNAGHEDYFFLHYAGHGIQVADISGDESDGQDEAIVPIDYSEGKPDSCILDDLLSDILVKGLPQGCRLTAVIDACHSGTALDLPFNYLCTGERDSLTLCTKKYLPLNGSVVSWSGCADMQESEEIKIKSGIISGLMTDAFIDSLKNNRTQTYQQLYDDIWARIALSHRQKPQLGVSHEIEADHPFVF